ncbi:hypothetical protein ACHAW6_013266 [Cyclotella cf. meneghiniana]
MAPMPGTDCDGSVGSKSARKSSRLKSISGMGIGKFKSKMMLKRSSTSGDIGGEDDRGGVAGERRGGTSEGKLYKRSQEDFDSFGHGVNDGDSDVVGGDAMAMEGVTPIESEVVCPSLHDKNQHGSTANQDSDMGQSTTATMSDGKDLQSEDDVDMKPISRHETNTPSFTCDPGPVANVSRLDFDSFHDPAAEYGQMKENLAGVVKHHKDNHAKRKTDDTQFANDGEHAGIIRKESSSSSDEGFVNGWKNVGKTNVNSENAHENQEDDIILDHRNVDAKETNESDDINGSDAFAAEGETDGFLDEYPVIMDQGNDESVHSSKNKRFQEEENLSASITAQMTPADSVSRANDMATTESIEKQTGLVTVSQPNLAPGADCISHDREKNVWIGNGMDIAIDETTSDCDPDEYAMNESQIDAAAAVNESSCHDSQSSTSQTQRSSPPTVNEPVQRPTKSAHPASKRSLRKAKNQHSHIPTATSMLHSEYNVDHSCSTPLERLARDVGNAFRQWHVHGGCDRHVSFEWANRMSVRDDDSKQEHPDDIETADLYHHNESVKTTQSKIIEKTVDGGIESESSQIMSMDVCMNRFANRSRKINEWMGDDATKIPSGVSIHANQAIPSPVKPPSPQASSNAKESFRPNVQSMSMEPSRIGPSYGARCIRSKKIIFETTGFTPVQNNDVSADESLPRIEWTRKRYSIPLLLSLWDAPTVPTGNDSGGIEDDNNTCGIPLSLRPHLSYSSHSLLGNRGIVSSCGTRRTFYEHSSGCNAENNKTIVFNHSVPPLDTGLGRDLSSLFDIGQHITLCLDLDSVPNSSRYRQESKHLQDIQSIYRDLRAYLVDTIHQATERKAHAAQERRRRRRSYRKRAMKRRHEPKRNFNSSKQPYQYKSTDDENIVEVGSQSMSCEDGEEQVMFCDSTDKDKTWSSNNNHYQRGAGIHDDDEISTSDDDTLMMTSHQDIHLDENEIDSEVISSLTAILQSALNLAASENDCCIPVFGLWGSYGGGSKDMINTEPSLFGGTEVATPSWIPTRYNYENNTPFNQHASNATKEDGDGRFKRLLLSSPAITGHCRQGTFRSTHRLYSIPRKSLPVHLSTLNGLSSVLLAQCSRHADTDRVVLTSARHCYHVDKMKGNNKSQEWRMLSFIANHESMSAVEVYRETCRRQALFLLERASSPWVFKSVPMWGPSEGNPLVSLSASVSWGVLPIHNSSDQESCTNPAAPAPPVLLQLPLKIRSSNFVPNVSELLDMEDSLQSTAFDPIGIGVEFKGGAVEFGPREPIFYASVRFDRDVPCATLSANTRCVLAALLRCGSLGLDALPGHLTRKKVLNKLVGPSMSSLDDEFLTESETMMRAALKHVGPVTRRLVEAMDWDDVGTISSNADVDRGIADALQRIGAGGLYPTPPVEVFAIESPHHQYNNTKVIHQSKAAPPGRLLSILFAHMARLRTPSSMMSLWVSFVEELRSRWDKNESLPNLGYIPGLDEICDAQPSITRGFRRSDHRVLGHRAHLAAFVNSSEPDPDRDQCIINQKLQVFNICIESKLSIEAMNKAHLVDEQSESMEEEDSQSSSDDDEFFDPEEEVSFESDSRDVESKHIEAMLKLEAAVVANPRHSRIGARCPVPDGLPLIKTGDQVYAPYLQRTLPMTDEEEEKQRALSGIRNNIDSDKRLSVHDRIMVAQRLQKPKLVSDMASFKAANQGAIFEDFVSWYGNPQNPLCEEVNGETLNIALQRRSKLSPEAAKVLALEEASEAIAILMSLRAFWEDSWDDAEPCPASEQQPLFDPYSTVEMLLHSFEIIHPSLLMGQALAVNLKNAEFVLETAAIPVKDVSSVHRALLQASTAIHGAVEMLTKDSLEGCLLSSPKTNSEEYPLVHVSASTIQKCEEACNAIGEMELVLSRALTLWQHCPEPDLVDSLLQCQEGSCVFLTSPKERNAFLAAIKNNQSMTSGCVSANHFPEAVMREYVIRNDDPATPCQLNARFVSDMRGGQSALLALTKTYRE